jgi:hypothetical protein
MAVNANNMLNQLKLLGSPFSTATTAGIAGRISLLELRRRRHLQRIAR